MGDFSIKHAQIPFVIIRVSLVAVTGTWLLVSDAFMKARTTLETDPLAQASTIHWQIVA